MHKSKRSWLILFLAVALFLVNIAAQSQSHTSQRHRDTMQHREAAQTQQPAELLQSGRDGPSKEFQRWNWFYQQRAYPLGYIPEEASQRAFKQTDQAKAEMSAQASQAVAPSWFSIGPAPILGGQIVGTGSNVRVSGRVRDITIDPTDSNHWMIATGGGVWETRDAGVTWIPKTDNEISLDIGAVAFAPSNPSIIYAGLNSAGRLGNGVLKSTDGGNTWHLLGTSIFANMEFFQFVDIKVQPTNANILLVATWDFFFPPVYPTAVGIFKSTDGGITWSRKLAGNGAELEVDPTNFNNQYAGIRTACFSTCDGSLNGVYRSTDAGETWQLINGPWGAISNGGSLELPIAPSSSNVLYAAIGNNNVNHVWRTNNAWAPTPSWVELPPTPGGELSSGGESIVDPSNANVLYSGSVGDLWKFDGANWNDVTAGTHVDQAAMAWAGNRLILGNDGGIWSTLNGGNTWTNHNTNLAITQFYRGSVHPTNPYFALGGSQDNGTEKWTGTNAWQFLFGGDGNANAISSTNPDTNWVFSACCHVMIRTTDGGASFTGADSGIDYTNAPFVLNFEKCPDDDNVFIAGTDNLWRTDNFFNSGSPSWSANGPKMIDSFGNPDPITAMAFAHGTSCRTYAYGTASGQLRLTTDGGASWRDIDINNAVPNRYVTHLTFHPQCVEINCSDTLYVTLSGFDEGTPGQPGHVFVTSNASSGSPTWTNITPPINIPYNVIAIGPGQRMGFGQVFPIYVGTDLGVLKSTDDGSTWNVAGNGLPNVPVLDLQVSGSRNRVVAFTYGRGAFSLPLQPETPFDFDGDRRSEIAYYRNGLWGVLKSTQSYSFGSAQFFSWGDTGLQPVSADFDGDGKADIAYIVPPSGGQSASYAILLSSKHYSFASGQPLFVPAGFPSLGDTPVVGDFDGDGKADPGIWRSSQGVWIIPLSSANYSSSIFTQWGQSGDTPLVGDIDGDGKADIGFYRNGLWGFLLSSQGYSTGSAQFFSWGGAGLQPVIADFDGDGKADIGYIVPPSGGQSAAYAILLSSRNYSFASGQPLFVPAGFPVLGDTPVVGDFDGDGKADPGIWRSSQGVWIIPKSSTNYSSFIFTQWGQAGDVPMPNSLTQN